MKKYIKSSSELKFMIDIDNLKIQSIVIVDDATEYDPKRDYVSASEYYKGLDVTKMNHDELMELPPKVRGNIKDIPTLRKLKYDELTVQQKHDVTNSNKYYDVPMTTAEKKKLLQKVQSCTYIYIKPRKKNNDFRKMLLDHGARLNDDCAKDIIDSLTYRDCKAVRYSYDEDNWNAVLMIFECSGSFKFPSATKGEGPIIISDLELYIKIDVDNESDDGYVAISFHESGVVDEDD